MQTFEELLVRTEGDIGQSCPSKFIRRIRSTIIFWFRQPFTDLLTKNSELSAENERLKAALYGIQTDLRQTTNAKMVRHLRKRAKKALAGRIPNNIASLEYKLKQLTGPTDHPEYYCHKCKGRNLVAWYVDSRLWNGVVREGGHEEILCPLCFADLCSEVFGDSIIWKLVAESDKIAAALSPDVPESEEKKDGIS